MLLSKYEITNLENLVFWHSLLPHQNKILIYNISTGYIRFSKVDVNMPKTTHTFQWNDKIVLIMGLMLNQMLRIEPIF